MRRVLRFLRHLPKHGWRCTIVCADRPYHPFHPDDPETAAALPPTAAVLRTPARAGTERLMTAGYRLLERTLPVTRREGGPKPARRVRSLHHETLLFPDAKRAWIRGAVRAALDHAQRDPFDLVFATGGPWSGLVAAERVARRLALPFVLDFRDGWTLDPREIWTGPRSRRLERRLLERAAFTTVATEWLAARMREQNPGLPAERLVALTNGYDLSEYPPPDPDLVDAERLVLTYTGTFNDTLPPTSHDQTPYYLLRAVAELDPGRRTALRLRLVGRLGPSYRRLVQELGLEGVVEMVGPVSHQRALQYQQAADVLLLVVYDCPAGPGVLTGKLVEYVGAQRPVLALAPRGEAQRMVEAHDLGWVVAPTDIDAIRRRLAQLIEARSTLGLSRKAPVPSLSAENLTERLARVLDTALHAHGESGQGR